MSFTFGLGKIYCKLPPISIHELYTVRISVVTRIGLWRNRQCNNDLYTYQLMFHPKTGKSFPFPQGAAVRSILNVLLNVW